MRLIPRLLLVITVLAQSHAGLLCPMRDAGPRHACCAAGQCRAKHSSTMDCCARATKPNRGCGLSCGCCHGKPGGSVATAAAEYLLVHPHSVPALLAIARVSSHFGLRAAPCADAPPSPPPRV